jgi:hypothetical protein
LKEDYTISPASGQGPLPVPAPVTTRKIRCCRASRFFILVVLALACIIAPLAAVGLDSPSDPPGVTGLSTPGNAATAGVTAVSVSNLSAGPQVISIGTYVLDITNYDARSGTFEINYFGTLTSDRPINMNDFETMNGVADKMVLFSDTPTRKYFRISGSMHTDPDFHRYPFDRHTLPVIIEPRVRNTSEIIFVIDRKTTGFDPLTTFPGWEIGKSRAYVMNNTYGDEEIPFSRAVFSYDISRDSFSTFLKFFIPVMLIILISLSSLLMKVTSRLGLNASMFLAAVLIHWRIADAMPNVSYPTFLDYFMILTYATLMMVLVSGILTIYFSEAKDPVRIEQVNRWSIRIIPALSISLYAVLFLTLLI